MPSATPATDSPWPLGGNGTISRPMSTLLNVPLGIALAATLAVLLTGIYSMARGGEFNRKYGNTLMRWRVALQGCALLILVVVMLLSGRG